MRLPKKTKLSVFLTLLACTAVQALAQPKFKYKAAVNAVNTNRFYSIKLQPALTAKCQPSLADIRLVDEKGKVVPYLPGNALPLKQQVNYKELPRVIATTAKDSLSFYIAENKDGLSIDRLWIKLRNTAVNRTVNLLGSDDLQHWFAIKEQINLQQTVAGNAGTFEDLLAFPASNYRYFKIQVNNNKLAPIHLLQAGIYSQKEAVAPAYELLPKASFVQENKVNATLINITLNDFYRIDKMDLQFTGTQYYKRQIEIYELNGKQKTWIKSTQVSSANNCEITLSGKAKQLQLLILNGDNPPLTLNELQFYQLPQSLVAYLEKQHRYQLQFGNDQLTAPQYDLQFFADSIGQQLPVVEHQAAFPVTYKPTIEKQNAVPVWLLWVAGAIALFVLLWLTLKMTKEVSSDQKQD